MKKRTIKAGKFQRHYPTNGILMYRERKNLIEVPEGTLVTILKARRQTHLCSVRCIEQDGKLVLGTGKKAVDVCIAIPTDAMPKLKIETAAGKSEKPASKSKGNKKGGKKAVVVAAENEQSAGIGPAELNAEQAQPEQEAPAPEQQAAAPQPEQAQGEPAPVVEQQAPAAEQAV